MATLLHSPSLHHSCIMPPSNCPAMHAKHERHPGHTNHQLHQVHLLAPDVLLAAGDMGY
jgi:hypothetical protein